MRKRKYEIDDSYFNNIDTHEKAYILGYIYSDGNVDDYSLNFTISNNDIELLIFLKKELNSTHPIKIKDKYCRIRIGSKKIAKDLNRLGVPHNKNNSLSLPKIDKELYPSFLLGFFDGDGHINDKESYISISGGEQILMQMKEHFNTILDLNMYFRYRYSEENKNSCSIEIKGSVKLNCLYDYLYTKSELGLKRKKEKFLKVIQKSTVYKKRVFKYNGNNEKIMKLYKLNFTNRKISELLDLNYNSVRSFVNKNKCNFIF